MTFKKIIGKVHLWLGLASGLVVVILGVTGCLYAFQHEIYDAVHKNVLYVQPQNKPALPLSELWTKTQAQLGKDHPVKYVTIYNTPGRSWEFHTYNTDPEALTYFGILKEANTSFINPYTGAVAGLVNDKYEFFSMVKWLHWSLWLKTEIGQPIVGIATLIFVLMLISGLILWWPRNKAARKQRFSVKWNASRKRLNYDLHNVFGFYCVTVGLIIALSGMVMAFTWFSKVIHFAATGKAEAAIEKPVTSVKPNIAVAENALDIAVATAWQKSPDAVTLSLSALPEKPDETIIITAYPSDKTYYQYSEFVFDQYSGALLRSKLYKDKPAGEKFVSMNYDIHVGAIAGLPGKIIAFCASFIAGSLPITGFLIWRGRKKKKKGAVVKKVGKNVAVVQ